MIVCVCPNPALDVTYVVPELEVGASHRVELVARRGGGKGLNVARVLRALGEPVRVIGLLGGGDGSAVAADLAAAGVEASFVPVSGATRRSTTVVAGASATVLNEPGPDVSAGEWAALVDRCAELLPRADVLVLSGSLPPGAPVDGYADLTARAHRAGARVLLDVGGAPLGMCLPTQPDVVKPNAAELGDLLGRPLASPGDVLDAAHEVVSRGAGAAVVSRGADGLVAVLPDGAYEVRPPAVDGNPTGAGDALAAGLAAGLLHGTGGAAGLARAASLAAAAAVAEPVAGAVDPARADRLLPDVAVRRLGADRLGRRAASG